MAVVQCLLCIYSTYRLNLKDGIYTSKPIVNVHCTSNFYKQMDGFLKVLNCCHKYIHWQLCLKYLSVFLEYPPFWGQRGIHWHWIMLLQDGSCSVLEMGIKSQRSCYLECHFHGKPYNFSLLSHGPVTEYKITFHDNPKSFPAFSQGRKDWSPQVHKAWNN